MLASRAPVTLRLTFFSLLVALIVGLPAGIVAAC
jgi:ABC-type dipeptide/oligopeptide/nickel transport system permease component